MNVRFGGLTQRATSMHDVFRCAETLLRKYHVTLPLPHGYRIGAAVCGVDTPLVVVSEDQIEWNDLREICEECEVVAVEGLHDALQLTLLHFDAVVRKWQAVVPIRVGKFRRNVPLQISAPPSFAEVRAAVADAGMKVDGFVSRGKTLPLTSDDDVARFFHQARQWGFDDVALCGLEMEATGSGGSQTEVGREVEEGGVEVERIDNNIDVKGVSVVIRYNPPIVELIGDTTTAEVKQLGEAIVRHCDGEVAYLRRRPTFEDVMIERAMRVRTLSMPQIYIDDVRVAALQLVVCDTMETFGRFRFVPGDATATIDRSLTQAAEYERHLGLTCGLIQRDQNVGPSLPVTYATQMFFVHRRTKTGTL